MAVSPALSTPKKGVRPAPSDSVASPASRRRSEALAGGALALDVLGIRAGTEEEKRNQEQQWRALMEAWNRDGTEEERQLALQHPHVFFQLDIANATANRNAVPVAIRNRHRSLAVSAARSAAPCASYEPNVSPTPPPAAVSPGAHAAEAAGTVNGLAPMFRVYGVTEDGRSVCANVHGFFPYFYCEVPPSLQEQLLKEPGGGEGTNAITARFKAFLDEWLLKTQSSAKAYDARCLDVRIEKKESLMYFKPWKGPSLFFRITLVLPTWIAPTRTLIERGISIDASLSSAGPSAPTPAIAQAAPEAYTAEDAEEDMNAASEARDEASVAQQLEAARALAGAGGGVRVPLPVTTYESNIPFLLRYLVDTKTTGCSWLVDIECVKLQGEGFPEPETDPVIQISSIVVCQSPPDSPIDAESPLADLEARRRCKLTGGLERPLCRVLFSLRECSSIPGAVVVWFDEEKEMLSKWAEFVREVDPDFLTGYNCVNFDLNYLITRAATLKVEGFNRLSRLKMLESKIRDSSFSSRALGTHEGKEIPTEGRMQFDLLELVRREYKLKSYSLNFVSFEFLKEQKEDVHYSMIGDLFRGCPSSRRRIGVYCLKDAYLPLRLLNELLFLYNYVEMSRVTGTPLNFLLTRGQQIKVTAQLLRKCKELNYVVPAVKRSGGDNSVQYEGATVLDPRKGFYDKPIATLDFASLYPSIMIAHNICYSTLVAGPDAQRVNNSDDVTVTTTTPAHKFVKAHVRRGVLPMIVEELIAARKVARKEMAAAKDEMTKKVLNGRQLALKISANSVYGYTGTTTGGQLPCLEVATTITCFGRDMIDFTRREVEKMFCQDKGRANNATVVYGDTDSVMVHFGDHTIAEAMQLGEEAAQAISAKFIKPIRLEFEKVYCPFLLMNKKRYAGLLYTRPDKYDKIDSKGIETVRRDFSLLVQTMADTVLRKMLIDKDVEAAKEYTRKKVAELLQNKIDLSLLVQTKSLGKIDYDTRLPHVELAKKLRKRDPGTAPSVGDRVSYVVIQGSKGQAQYERAEDPLYVLEHSLPIDTQHYLEGIKKPLCRIFEGVMSNPESLFTGTHTLKRTVSISTQGALSKFIQRGLQCVGCRSVIREGTLCRHCQKNEAEIVVAKMAEMAAKEKEHSDLWTECQRCQGSLHQDVICVNRDCPIFYRRVKVKKEIGTLEERLSSLSLTTEW
ncbi:DNA polymerase [Besnoitia besnoiti]|uniref:DNA polymerase n=1 Tax=Besnoitia besnoiti TaxID=94643 RepID=A0A2A9MC69_BESBE|nr:DNA polymerase [Besnoitia besnoiti]PFH33207.1 DNA polymerase [Besnoitia besnoiti]